MQLKESQHEVEELKNEASHQLEAAQKKRDELIQQGENELEAARAKARALAQQVESQAYALTDELRQLQKDERLSTQQKASVPVRLPKRNPKAGLWAPRWCTIRFKELSPTERGQ